MRWSPARNLNLPNKVNELVDEQWPYRRLNAFSADWNAARWLHDTNALRKIALKFEVMNNLISPRWAVKYTVCMIRKIWLLAKDREVREVGKMMKVLHHWCWWNRRERFSNLQQITNCMPVSPLEILHQWAALRRAPELSAVSTYRAQSSHARDTIQTAFRDRRTFF